MIPFVWLDGEDSNVAFSVVLYHVVAFCILKDPWGCGCCIATGYVAVFWMACEGNERDLLKSASSKLKVLIDNAKWLR
jgi:hypothetical protein